MPKVRVYEIARQLGIGNQELVAQIKGMGIPIRNHMSTLTPDEVQQVRAVVEQARRSTTEEVRLGTTVIRRRSKVKRWPKDVEGARKPAARPAAATQQDVEPPAQPAAESPEEPTPESAAATEGRSGEVPALEDSVVLAGSTAESEAAEGNMDVGEAAGVEPQSLPDEVPDEETRPAGEESRQVDEPPAPAVEEAESPDKPVEKVQAERPEPAAKTASQPRPAKEPEEEKLGPTGRRIELSQLRPKPKVVITDLGASRGLYRTRERNVWPDRRGGRTQKGGRKRATGRKAQHTQITTPAEHKRRIRMETTISVTELAKQMGIKATEALKKLWALGMRGVTINTSLDEETATLLAADFGFDVENVAFQEEQVIPTGEDRPEDFVPRGPVVTIMGHVDHGKTSLLDRIRKSDITGGEAGGITQHIGAYKVKTKTGDIVFIDTPGHEAFTKMRARGAQSTDLVILVVAADDGIMPQTKEAIQHSQDAKVPMVVAINKIDKADAEPERVKQQLTEFGLVPEAWGGDTLMVEVSAATGQGIDQLLEMVLLQAEMLELKANPNKEARGIVLEAMLDRARGPVATILVQEGTLKTGDVAVAGEYFGRVRAMLDDKGRRLSDVTPVTPVLVLGLDGVPDSGEKFYVLPDEKTARRLVEHRRDQKRKKELAETSASSVRLERIVELIKEGQVPELKIVLKADVQGTAEAVKDALLKLSTDKVRSQVVLSGVGGVTETDVTFAKASGAIIVGFNVRPAGKASQLAEQEGVEIRLYEVIYELLDDMKEAMRGLLPKERREKAVGHAEVRETFSIPKIGTIAGCFVQDGRITRSSLVRIYRNDVKVYQGRIGSLKRFKDDVKEVEKGYECGLSIEGYNDIKVGDVIEAYEVEELAPTL